MIQSENFVTAISEIFLPYAFVIVRILAIISMIPVFGNTAIPPRVKLVLGISFGIVIAPIVLPKDVIGQNSSLNLLIIETLIGLIIGITLRGFVHVLQIAGAIAAQSFSISQNANLAGSDPLPAVGSFIVWAGLATLLTMGYGDRFLIILIQSYDAFPFGQWPNAADILDRYVWIADFSFALALQLALPFCATALIYNLILGAANKIMPQLMVMLVGAPAGMIAVIGILAGGSSIISMIWAKEFLVFVSGPM